MNQKDKDSLTGLLHQINDRFQALSNRIHWTADDSECLDNLMNSKEQIKRISDRILRTTGSEAFAMYLPLLLAFKGWQRTKAVYSFDREFVDAMSYTEDTTILISLLEKLPFKDMLFFFPEGTLPKTKDEETAGMFVHIESHHELLWVSFNYLNRKRDNGSQILPGVSCAFPITNGMKVSEVFKTSQYLEWLPTYTRTVMINRHLCDKEAKESILEDRTALYLAINLMYYLSSKEPDIKQIKRRKKPQKPSRQKEENDPVIKLHEVGTKYAEIVFRRLQTNRSSGEEDANPSDNTDDESSEDASIRSENRAKKRRPHVRRAHFQHYWTGEGHSIPVLRWKSDLFVGVNRDDQAIVVYEAKESMKGKRNTNTSKKKRSK